MAFVKCAALRHWRLELCSLPTNDGVQTPPAVLSSVLSFSGADVICHYAGAPSRRYVRAALRSGVRGRRGREWVENALLTCFSLCICPLVDVLVRVLGQYLVGITPSTVSLGVWGGNLELYNLAVRPDALAVLLETLGLDLPVTCIAGTVGNLILRVPWKALRSQPVILTVRDLVVVASPVSDGDQKALEQRDARLKAARLEADDALRAARFSVRAATARLAQWRQRFTSSLVTAVVGNMQVVVENVIVQYQDASSVRDRPYTVTIAMDSMRFASTDASWKESEAPSGDDDTTATDSSDAGAHREGNGVRMVRKVLHLEGLVANWIPGIGDNSHETLDAKAWASAIRSSTNRRVIHPMSGRLRIALADGASAPISKSFPKVELDLCFPEVQLAFDDFQYHTLLSTIMYLSDIDRKVRPKSPRGRWFWALERLLPRFKNRYEERLRFTVEGLRERREQRLLYVRARKAVVLARMKSADLDCVSTEVSVLRDMELLLSLSDVLLFRDNADRELAAELVSSPASSAATASRLWSSIGGVATDSNPSSLNPEGDPESQSGTVDRSSDSTAGASSLSNLGPTLRMAFLLGRGSIQLSRGGFPEHPVGISRLVFHELRLGVTTWAQTRGLLIEALLGTLDVHDLQSDGRARVLYPRVEWAGRTSSNVTGDGNSYPEQISLALEQIRGSHEKSDPALFRPTDTGLEASQGIQSSGSSSRMSLHSESSSGCGLKLEDISFTDVQPLQYLVALRLQSEDSECFSQAEAPCGSPPTVRKARPRLAMDLAIGGVEAIVDGPSGSFVSSVSFWHPREKLPSIMQFLGRAAAPRLALLRMDIQRVLEDRKAPMRMDLLIRAPRFVFPGPIRSGVSLVLDLGTFAMETFDGTPVFATSDIHACKSEVPLSERKHYAEAQCTDYRMTGSDLGIFIVSAAGKKAAERLVKPFSLRVLLQVLNDAAYIEAVMGHSDIPLLSKVRMFGRLSSVRTTISHAAFRSLLKVAHQWSEWTSVGSSPSGIEPNSPHLSSSALLPASNVAVPPLVDKSLNRSTESRPTRPVLTVFDMRLELDNLLLELRDSSGRRVVTLSTEGTEVKAVRQRARVELDYRIQAFSVEDGSRGATAPFRRLVYAGLSEDCESSADDYIGGASVEACGSKDNAFVHVRYSDNIVEREQELVVNVVSLSVVCVRETYLALADFFYRSDNVAENAFVDPFVAVGMTTSEAVLALRDQAERGVELSKQAFAQRGELKVSALLDGIDVTLVAAEGGIASFELKECAVRLSQSASGDVHASGNFRTLAVRDLTAVYDLHSQAITYHRDVGGQESKGGTSEDGWTFDMPATGDKWWRSRLTNMRIVFVRRFVVILRQYLNALRDELQPILSLKGGLSELFESESADRWKNVPGGDEGRLRLDVQTKDIDVIMPRHSQSPHEGLRFFVETSSVTNDEPAAPGYLIGMRLSVSNVSSFVLYSQPSDDECIVQPLHFASREDLVPFSTRTAISGKLDMWRTRRVPRVVLNSEGIPVLKEGELEMDYNPRQWLPALRARLCAGNGLSARLCEAEYSILYFTFTENIIERPEIEFTDIVRGLKTPILPPRLPVQPIMLSSNRMPPNYSIVFDIPSISSVIQSGGNQSSAAATLIGVELSGVSGRFDYGVDYRLSLEVAADVKEMSDLRPGMRKGTVFAVGRVVNSVVEEAREQTITLSWDRPFGHRANIMLVASGLRILVIPELFRDLAILTAPGFPFLETSAPAPFVEFNGRLLIVTLSNPEIWLMEDENDSQSAGIRTHGDVIAKVQWSAVTGRLLVDVASKGFRASLCHIRGEGGLSLQPEDVGSATILDTPLVYPLDVSLRYHAGGYDPAPNQSDAPIRRPGSTLSVNAESLLARVDVKDTPNLLAIGSRLALLPPSELSRRSPTPGRFDEWADTVEEGDAKLTVHFALPHARVLFTDEIYGRHVPIMEIRARDALLRSNVPWLTNARVELSVDLFNEFKGWWEPGIEKFPIELTTSQGRSGSIAINARSTESIDINVTPSTISGAARVVKSIKSAVDGLQARMHGIDDGHASGDLSVSDLESTSAPPAMLNGSSSAPATSEVPTLNRQRAVPKKRDAIQSAQRPSVAAFCVQNWTGRPVTVWQKHVSARWPLRGDGGEVEMDLPTDHAIWPVLVDDDGVATDANRNRHALLRCTVAMSGYRAISLSAAEVGVSCVSMIQEQSNHGSDRRPPLQVVWDVSMRDGVPVACLRSAVRIFNRTDTVIEVGLGDDLNHSSALSASLISADRRFSRQGVHSARQCLASILRAGDTFHVPVASIDQVIRVRPALFSAPGVDEAGNPEDHDRDSHALEIEKQSVLYSYKWSEPLSKLESFRKLGVALIEGDQNNSLGATTVPATSCASTHGSGSWTFTVTPVIRQAHSLDAGRASSLSDGWVDLELQAPIVLENCMPRELSFAIAESEVVSLREGNAVLASGKVEPLRRSHVHTAGSDLTRLALGLGYDNVSACATVDDVRSQVVGTAVITSFYADISQLLSLPVGSAKAPSLHLKLDHEETPGCRILAVHSDFWLQNRSDVDLFFRDYRSESYADEQVRPKSFIRASPYGFKASPYVCFSGPWLTLQQGNATEDIWVQVPQDISEIDKPLLLNSQGLGLSLDVRPARGKFRRSLVATIRNTGWIENHTEFHLQWCQSAALSARGILLSSHVHTLMPWKSASLHWDFVDQEKSVCIRRVDADGSSTWMWSRPVAVEGVDGEFAAKMYRPNRHEQYIARAVVFNLKAGAHLLALHPEDRNNPPYRIINQTAHRSIAFRQSGSEETHPWLVRPGKATRYSWDNPRAPLKRRSLLIEVIEHREVPSRSSSIASLSNMTTSQGLSGDSSMAGPSTGRIDDVPSEVRRAKFELSIDVVSEEAQVALESRLGSPLSVSVCVDGPTKVVTFRDMPQSVSSARAESGHKGETTEGSIQALGSDVMANVHDRSVERKPSTVNVDVEVRIAAVGISLIDKAPSELLFVKMSDLAFRLDRFEGYEMLLCEVRDLQVDNQLPNATWPVLMWSPAQYSNGDMSSSETNPREARKPFFQLSMDGKYPRYDLGISRFRGIFAALQHVELALDEDCLLRLVLFGQDILEASGEGEYSGNEDVSPDRRDIIHVDTRKSNTPLDRDGGSSSVLVHRLYVEQLELCPVKLTVSFASSRSALSVRVAGYRNLMRTMMAVFGNVDKAEFRFNALELRHVFDTTMHFQSLIAEFYVAQSLGQKMALIASNPLVGNPSALFDSIAIGTRDFFVEPSRAKGSADFIAGIGRGSSSLLTNTVGGIVGSLGGIPRAVAQGLETAVGDKEYLAARDSIRSRSRYASSPAEGLVTGAMSFGHGIASGATGLVRDPMIGAMESGPGGFIRGLGKGVVGGVLKPIAGALDLIGEPAVGFRSMMTSSVSAAEPLRPARAFWGSTANRLVTYDLHAALGQSVLESVGRLRGAKVGGNYNKEELWAWTPLVALHPGSSSYDLSMFLWALKRRSSSGAPFRSRSVLDGHGEPQRAENFRCGLVTQLRVVITSLPGHVLWECPLSSIVDTQVSLQDNDILMIGVKANNPSGSFRTGVPSSWERIACGSSSRRDSLNSALKKALKVYRGYSTEATSISASTAAWDRDGRGSIEKNDMVELADLSPAATTSFESARVAPDGVEGSREVMTTQASHRRIELETQARSGVEGPGPNHDFADVHENVAIASIPFESLGVDVERAISLRITVRNECDEGSLTITDSPLSSGTWSTVPSGEEVIPGGALTCEVSGDGKVTFDLSGALCMKFCEFERPAGSHEIEGGRRVDAGDEEVISLCFMVPLMERNEYVLHSSARFRVERVGGDAGDQAHVVVKVSQS